MWCCLDWLVGSIIALWLLASDWNAVLSSEDYKRAKDDSTKVCNTFEAFFFNNSLRDMDFVGPKFTWSRGETCERMDRAIFKIDLNLTFLKYKVQHLHRLKSDHWPLWKKLDGELKHRMKRPFISFARWLLHESFLDFVRLNWNETGSIVETICWIFQALE